MCGYGLEHGHTDDHLHPDSELKTEDRPARPASPVDQRINRLSTAALKRIIEPDVDVLGEIGDGQVLPDEIDEPLERPRALCRTDRRAEEGARARGGSLPIVDTGIRFESVLMAGFSFEIVSRRDLTDPRVTYLLHEMGEETRHSRLFVRLLQQLGPTAKNRSTGRWHASPNTC